MSRHQVSSVQRRWEIVVVMVMPSPCCCCLNREGSVQTEDTLKLPGWWRWVADTSLSIWPVCLCLAKHKKIGLLWQSVDPVVKLRPRSHLAIICWCWYCGRAKVLLLCSSIHFRLILILCVVQVKYGSRFGHFCYCSVFSLLIVRLWCWLH